MNESDRSVFDDTIVKWNFSTFPDDETLVRSPLNVIVLFIIKYVFIGCDIFLAVFTHQFAFAILEANFNLLTQCS